MPSEVHACVTIRAERREDPARSEGAEGIAYGLHSVAPRLLRSGEGLQGHPRAKHWAGTTPRVTLATQSGQKGGRSSPVRCFARAQILCRAKRNLNALRDFVHPQGEPNVERRSEPCLSCTYHHRQQIPVPKDKAR